MDLVQWLKFFLVIQLIHGLGTWKLYVKADRKAFEAFIPIFNSLILMKIINRPMWWVFLLFIPVINVIMLIIIWVETARSFGKNNYIDTILSVLTLGFYSYYLNYFTDVKHIKNRTISVLTQSAKTKLSNLFIQETRNIFKKDIQLLCKLFVECIAQCCICILCVTSKHILGPNHMLIIQ